MKKHDARPLPAEELDLGDAHFQPCGGIRVRRLELCVEDSKLFAGDESCSLLLQIWTLAGRLTGMVRQDSIPE